LFVLTLVPHESSEIEVDVKGAIEISAQFKNDAANNTSLKIYSSLGLGYAKLHLKNITLVKDNNQIIIIESGYYTLNFEFLNNDLNNSTKISYIIVVKK
jgi:hypothetical protein